MTTSPRYLLRGLVLLAVALFALSQGGPQAKRSQISADKLELFVGQYQYDDDPDLVWSVSVDAAHLFIESRRSARRELVPQSEDAFSLLDSQISLKFIRSADGDIIGFNNVAADGSTRHARKTADEPLEFHKPKYTREDFMIPVRDGVKLHAAILRPEGSTPPLPFLLMRTPYGVGNFTPDSIASQEPEFAASGYIFVFEDIRGRYKSEGTFVMSRPMADHHNPTLVDESTDAYDTVAWLVKNIPNNNGRVGVFGVSYPGFLAMAAAIDPHPAIKAISPQAAMIDVWLGDDFFHNGAFRETYGYDYILGMERSKENAFSKLDEDAYDFFLRSGSFHAAAERDGVNELPTSIAFIQHPRYDEFWRARAVERHLGRVTVPALFVGGFWDQEDMFGPQEAYTTLEPRNSDHENFLVIGPWNHGQWRATRHLGAIQFGEPTSDEFRARYEAPFFAYYLKGEVGFNLKDTAAFETGSNRWLEYSHWPPTESKPQSLYLCADGSLALSSPQAKKSSSHCDAGAAKYREYSSDPGSPVPYRHRPIQATYAPDSHWYNWMVEDQRFVSGRPDVATWTTAPLDRDISIAGDVIADLFASTSGTDSDWVVKLIDEYPDPAVSQTAGGSGIDSSSHIGTSGTGQSASTAALTLADARPNMAGYQLIINAEIFRGRYRKSFEHPQPIRANAVLEYHFSLHAADHTFLKGHRIEVQVQSTWFPLYDRNPQKFVANIMTASRDDFSKATQRIYPASQLILPVAP